MKYFDCSFAGCFKQANIWAIPELCRAAVPRKSRSAGTSHQAASGAALLSVYAEVGTLPWYHPTRASICKRYIDDSIHQRCYLMGIGAVISVLPVHAKVFFFPPRLHAQQGPSGISGDNQVAIQNLRGILCSFSV